jgi:hypothetical protein
MIHAHLQKMASSPLRLMLGEEGRRLMAEISETGVLHARRRGLAG